MQSKLKKSSSKTSKKTYTRKGDLCNIIFKKINENYAWGKYGDIKVIIMKENSYINVTKICNDATTKNNGKKEFRQWKLLSVTHELLNEVSALVRIPPSELLITPKGLPNKLRGTYAHPDLVPHIASWASPQFAVRVSKIVNEYFAKQALAEKNKLLREKDDKIDQLDSKIDQLLNDNDTLLTKTKKMDKRIKRLLSKNDDLYEQNEEILHKVDRVSNDRLVSTGRVVNDHLLVIIKNNDDEEEYDEDEICYDYHALRVMRKSLKPRLASHKARHPDMEVIFEIAYSPNSMNLWTRIKQQLGTGKRKKLRIDNCKFNLRKKYTEKGMIEDIQAIHDERF